MDLRQLEMFRAVAEEGSFTRASRRLHVSQSAVSRQVRMLEDELAGRLLVRGARGTTLTRTGELLLELAHRIDKDIEDVLGEISESQGLLRGSLVIAGGMTVCMHLLPRVLRKYRGLYPGVDLRVVTGRTEVILGLLRRREADLAMLTLPIADPRLEVIPLIREEMVVASAPRHPLSRLRSVAPSELAAHPLILYEVGSNTRRVQDRLFLDNTMPMEIAMETENVEIIKAMVSAGLGVTVIPYTSIVRDQKTRRFGVTRLKGRKLYRETGWVFPRSDFTPRPVRAMLELFESMKAQFTSDRYLTSPAESNRRRTGARA